MNLRKSNLGEEISAKPRTIRVLSDDDFLCVDIIPSRLGPLQREVGAPIWAPKGREVLEDSSLFRIAFNWVVAFIAMKEGRPHPCEWDTKIRQKYKSDMGYIVDIAGSPWRASLEDWQGSDNPLVTHTRIIGWDMEVDVLGVIDHAEWLPNTAAALSNWYDTPTADA